MFELSVPMQVLVTSVVSMLATGLGAFPVLLMPRRSEKYSGAAHALAGGFMISASVFSIGLEALHVGSALELAGGMMAGALFLWGVSKLMGDAHEHSPADDEGIRAASGRRSKLILVALFLHSIPEGMAIGVGYATDDIGFGLLMAVAIAIHNVPEGIAMSLPLRESGASGWKCFWTSVLTSLPQALLALPSYLIVERVQFLLPSGLAFAGGAMIYLVVVDLLPESYEKTDRVTAAWSFMIGLVVMMLLTVWAEKLTGAV